MLRKPFPLLFLFFLLISPLPAFPAQIFVMNEQERLTGSVSSKDLNRLQVVGERIASVFGSQGAFSLEQEEVRGQVFLKVHEGAPPRLDVSVVTESGLTQDLVLKVTKGEGQTLLLKPFKKSSDTWGETSGDMSPSLDLIKAMATSSSEAGYGRKKTLKPVSLWKDVEVTLLETWTGEGLEGHLYQVKNTSGSVKVFHEKHFQLSARTLAISLDRFRLPPGVVMKAYVIVGASHG